MYCQINGAPLIQHLVHTGSSYAHTLHLFCTLFYNCLKVIIRQVFINKNAELRLDMTTQQHAVSILRVACAAQNDLF